MRYRQYLSWTFTTALTRDEMLVRLQQQGMYPWLPRDSERFAEYLSAARNAPTAALRIRIFNPWTAPRQWVCDLGYESDADDAERSFRAHQAYVEGAVMAAVEAHDVAPDTEDWRS